MAGALGIAQHHIHSDTGSCTNDKTPPDVAPVPAKPVTSAQIPLPNARMLCRLIRDQEVSAVSPQCECDTCMFSAILLSHLHSRTHQPR